MLESFFVVHVMTGCEQQFLKYASTVIESATIQFWWPRRELFIQKARKKKLTLQPLFPGYLFLQTAALTKPLIAQIKLLPGFIRFLKNNMDIHPLTDADRHLIQHFLSYGEIIPYSKAHFDINNNIVILHGPLKGIEGKIIKINRRKGRAKIRLNLQETFMFVDLGFETIDITKEQIRLSAQGARYS